MQQALKEAGMSSVQLANDENSVDDLLKEKIELDRVFKRWERYFSKTHGRAVSFFFFFPSFSFFPSSALLKTKYL